ALHLSLDGVPDRVDPGEVTAWLARQEGIRDVHDLHIWPLSTTRTALAVHVVSGAQDTDALLHDLAEGLEHGFGIAHSTIQVEREPCGAGCLRPIK
ncbi:MAG: cation transporter, partial [Sphingomonadales bacterium]|nr:cation transporter [Sphingomonadales bacterium]